MSDFPKASRIELANNVSLRNENVMIIEEGGGGFTLTLPGEVWTFPPGANSDPCVLRGGTMPGSKRVLEVQGSCSRSPGTDVFQYIIGITRDPSQPPDHHIVEWVSEDEG